MIENDSSSNYLIWVIEWIIHPVKLGLLQAIQQNFVFPPNAWNLWHLSSDQFERKIIISSEFSKECWVPTCSIDDKLRLPQTVFHLARSLFIDNSFNNSIRITSDNWRASLIYCCIRTYYLKSVHIRCVCWCCCSRYTDLRNIIDGQMFDVLLDCIRFLQNIHVVICVCDFSEVCHVRFCDSVFTFNLSYLRKIAMSLGSSLLFYLFNYFCQYWLAHGHRTQWTTSIMLWSISVHAELCQTPRRSFNKKWIFLWFVVSNCGL